MQRTLLSRRKLDPQYLSAMPVVRYILQSKNSGFPSSPTCHRETLPHFPSDLFIRIESVFYTSLVKSVWWYYGRLLYFIGLSVV